MSRALGHNLIKGSGHLLLPTTTMAIIDSYEAGGESQSLRTFRRRWVWTALNESRYFERNGQRIYLAGVENGDAPSSLTEI